MRVTDHNQMIRQSSKEGTKAKLLAAMCVATLCVILVLGLWPFHAPRNEVTWSKNSNGLQFGDYGTVLSTSEFKSVAPQDGTSRSIEIWIRPRSSHGGGTLLAFHAAKIPFQFLLHQSLADLKLDCTILGVRNQTTSAGFYVSGVFRHVKLVFITITSGTRGTEVYADGTLITSAPHFRPLGGDFGGRLVVGDSPGQGNGWAGHLRGLAIYDSELTPQQVVQNYQSWTRMGQPALAANENCIALYLFDERSGRVVHNRVNSETDLHIPEKYAVLDQLLLEPFWKEFNSSWGYWTGALKNVVGFVPLGFFFYAYLSYSIRRAALVTVILGGAVSLTIEILQAYLPTRDSGMTDLITNTLGAYIGVQSYRTISPRLARYLTA
ncbi:MAG: VanZ family protein [Bryobacteraceae bacterium]